MKNVSFITTENDDDLIVSFAIPDASFADVKSLTLLRTPKYDCILDDTERGVWVSYDDFPADDDDLLEAIEIQHQRVIIRTRHRDYDLSVRGVDPEEMEEAIQILKKMNVDNRFTLRVVMEEKRSEPHADKADDPQDLVQRLLTLEDDFPPELREACVAAGAALVPELIHQLEAMLDADALGWPALYATELLGTIGDSRAAPALLRCLEQRDEFEILNHEACTSPGPTGRASDGTAVLRRIPSQPMTRFVMRSRGSWSSLRRGMSAFTRSFWKPWSALQNLEPTSSRPMVMRVPCRALGTAF